MESGQDLRKARESETCGTCRFFSHDAGDTDGWCRRYPPVFESRGDESEYGFTKTISTLWCGEWKTVNELG